MGIKKFFKTKPPTEEQAEAGMIERMMDKGMLVKQESKNKPSTFSAYAEYANDKFKGKREYAPKGYSKQEKEEAERAQQASENLYSQGSDGSGISSGNPYASLGTQSNNSNPYGNQFATPGGSGNPYANQGGSTVTGDSNGSYNSGGNPYSSHQPRSQQNLSDPYGSQGYSDPYSQPSSQQSTQYNSPRVSNPYAQSQRTANPYASQRSNTPQQQDEFSFEPALEKTQTNQTSRTGTSYMRPYQQQQQQQLLQEEYDLNDSTYADEDLNDSNYRMDYNQTALYQEGEQQQQQRESFDPPHEETEEERLQREEDEDVEQIKGQIRFTKQESVASTRNTLRMAREAEESGKNTMGVLGAQAETLYNTERNLQLAEAQDKMAKEKVAQLHHYNRNILKPGMKNPFTKNARLRAQEERLKQDRIEFKLEQQRQRSELNGSTQRAKMAIDDADGMGQSIADKYRREKIKEQAKQYQFEADSEDDEMENEIGENLDEIGRIAGRLKGLAVTQGKEIERQNASLRNIEEQADKLDVNLHVNAANLRRAR
ncbi:Protein transport protein SEC9 [Cyberlindnera fabianii]|uniref:Protein transport protein SEC9 n=1 Tax=Cyberlindnera fabianii TaxID=36022 RepID=A0A1V2L692_CYBFA|nr:Protein transport protein SEC9 [Cyberlindnera fabianii]